MTTKVTVFGAVNVTSILHGATDRETEEQRATDVTEKREASWPIHNTLSLRLEGNGRATIETSEWPVGVRQGPNEELRVEPDNTYELKLVGVPVTVRELSDAPADEQPAGGPAVNEEQGA